MKHFFLTLAILLFIPASVSASRPFATFTAGQSVVSASSSPGNAYAAGASVVLTAPVAGDLVAVGGSLIAGAQVAGDQVLIGGSVRSQSLVGGDVRAVAGSVTLDEGIGGDLVAFGYSVQAKGHVAQSVFVGAVNVVLSDGATGPVTIYANNVSLAGEFGSDVRIVASGRVLLAQNTVIHGRLSYESPEPAIIPSSVQVDGGVAYTSASYLPSIGTSRVLALINLGFFIFVRIFGALLLAGLLAGLFPKLAEAVVLRVYDRRLRSILLTTLLGFAIFVATPILILLLALTFVGLGFAILLCVGYALLFLLAILYAGILIGSMFARKVLRRESVLWHDGSIGMLVLSIVALIPVVGFGIAVLLTLFAAGALLQIFFHFAFLRDEHTQLML